MFHEVVPQMGFQQNQAFTKGLFSYTGIFVQTDVTSKRKNTEHQYTIDALAQSTQSDCNTT